MIFLLFIFSFVLLTLVTCAKKKKFDKAATPPSRFFHNSSYFNIKCADHGYDGPQPCPKCDEKAKAKAVAENLEKNGKLEDGKKGSKADAKRSVEKTDDDNKKKTEEGDEKNDDGGGQGGKGDEDEVDVSLLVRSSVIQHRAPQSTAPGLMMPGTLKSTAPPGPRHRPSTASSALKKANNSARGGEYEKSERANFGQVLIGVKGTNLPLTPEEMKDNEEDDKESPQQEAKGPRKMKSKKSPAPGPRRMPSKEKPEAPPGPRRMASKEKPEAPPGPRRMASKEKPEAPPGPRRMASKDKAADGPVVRKMPSRQPTEKEGKKTTSNEKLGEGKAPAVRKMKSNDRGEKRPAVRRMASKEKSDESTAIKMFSKAKGPETKKASPAEKEENALFVPGLEESAKPPEEDDEPDAASGE